MRIVINLKFKTLYYDFSHLHFEFPANNNGPMKSVKIKTRKQKKVVVLLSPNQDGNNLSEFIMNLSESVTVKITHFKGLSGEFLV